MSEQCPICGAPLVRGRTQRIGGKVRRRRDCQRCNYGDVGEYEPESLLRIFAVKRRQNKIPDSESSSPKFGQRAVNAVPAENKLQECKHVAKH